LFLYKIKKSTRGKIEKPSAFMCMEGKKKPFKRFHKQYTTKTKALQSWGASRAVRLYVFFIPD
jgi:hypothetical protein